MTGSFSFRRSMQAWPVIVRGLGSVVGLMFVGFGCWTLVSGGRAWITWWQIRSWGEAKATIQSIQTQELGDHPRTRSGQSYVDAKYTYSWEGHQFEGRRVFALVNCDGHEYGSSESVQKLVEAKKSGRAVPCLVNPKCPEQAILSQHVSMKERFAPLWMGSLFTILGGGVASACLCGWVSRLRWRARRRAFPGEPWKWYPTWAERRLKPCNQMNNLALWWIVCFFGGITFPASVLGIPSVLRDGPLWAVPLILFFDVLTLIILVTAARRTLSARRFAGSRLELDRTPVWLGGGLQGVLVVSGSLGWLTDFRATLECNCWQLQGDSLTPTTIWSKRQRVPTQDPEFGQTELRVPVHLEIPEECPEWSDVHPYNRIEWLLTVQARTAGPDLDLCFEIPVFRPQKADGTSRRKNSCAAN